MGNDTCPSSVYDKLITPESIAKAANLGALRDILTLGDHCETVSMVDPVFKKMPEFLNSKTAWEALSLTAEYEDMGMAVKALRYLGETVQAKRGINNFFAERVSCGHFVSKKVRWYTC